MAKKKRPGKGKSRKDRFLNDPSYARTRENIREFQEAMQAGKLIRDAFRGMVNHTGSASRSFVMKMHQGLILVLKSDSESDRGSRQISKGNLGLLTKFEFNNKASISSVLFTRYQYSADRSSGKLSLQFPAFVPTNSLSAPKATTHFRIVTAAAELDFENNNYLVNQTRTDQIPFDNAETSPFGLELTITPNSKQAFMHVFTIEFYQEVNGKMYILKDDTHNCLSVLLAESAVA